MGNRGWYCLGKTATGHPRHPSRLGNMHPLEPLTAETHSGREQER
jgi:hypothetical protein